MSHRRIELCVSMPGGKTPDDPLAEIEVMALVRFSPTVLAAIQEKRISRTVDYLGNYFLLFPEEEKEAVCQSK